MNSNCWSCGRMNSRYHNGQMVEHGRTHSLLKAPYNRSRHDTVCKLGWSVRRLAGKSYVNRRRSNCWWCGMKNNWCHNGQTAQHDRTRSLSKAPCIRCRCGIECRLGLNAHQSMRTRYENRKHSNCWWCGIVRNRSRNDRLAEHDKLSMLKKLRCSCRQGGIGHN